MKPTKEQIESEIKALEASKAYVPRRTMFGDDNHHKLDLQIDYLRGEIDMTSGEYDNYSDDDQSAIMEAEQWEAGYCKESPSSGWESFKPKTEPAKKNKATKKRK